MSRSQTHGVSPAKKSWLWTVPPRVWIVATVITLVWAVPILAQSRTKVTVPIGQSVTQPVAGAVKTVSIANSDVADVVVLGPHEVLINGKGIGITTLVVWDQDDNSTMFDVVVRGQFSDEKIELRVQLAELNHTLAEEYGLDALVDHDGGHSATGASYAGDVAGPQVPLGLFQGDLTEGVDLAMRYAWGRTEIQAILRALSSSGVLRTLAKPTVVAASGEKASFLSGGEIPVPIASSGTSGGSTVTVEWKEFGVKVDFVPTIVDEGVINLKIAPEASSLDYNNGVQLSGFQIPAIRSRKAETTVELRNNETLVIGGLIMEEEVDFESKVPILGDIPLLGYLFRGTSKSTTITELLIVVSPRIVRGQPPGTKIDLPTDRGRIIEEDTEDWLQGNDEGNQG